jgi:hypothetical protein
MSEQLAPTETRASIAGFDAGAAGVTPPSNPDRRGVFLADVIVELGLADQATIETAVKAAQENEKPLEQHLLDAGILDEERLSRAVADRNGLDHVDLDLFEVDMGAAELVGRSAAERYCAVPIAFASDGALIVAVQDPFDTLGIIDIEVMTRSQVRPVIASASCLLSLIERLPEQAAPTTTPPVEEEPTMPESFEDDPRIVEPTEEPAATIQPTEEPVNSFEPTEEPVASGEVGEVGEVELPPLSEVDLAEITPVAEAPEPVAEAPVPEQGPEPEPEPIRLHEVGQAAPAGTGLSELETEIGSLQETARRADELAVSVERRIGELKSADERSARLEADLDVAQGRVEELEARMAGVDTLAEELRSTTAKLEEVNRILEGSVG